MSFNQTDLDVLCNTDFLLRKSKLIDQLRELLAKTRLALQHEIKLKPAILPGEVDLNHGKISRGENYEHLPYLVLDFPAFFDKQNIFAFRTMFWWGHFFSFTWHLQGKYWMQYRTEFASRFETLPSDLFICVNDTPWSYHYRSDNYVSLHKVTRQEIMEFPFLKISRKIPIEAWNQVPQTAVQGWQELSLLLIPSDS